MSCELCAVGHWTRLQQGQAVKSLGCKRKLSTSHCALQSFFLFHWMTGALWNVVTGLYSAITSVISPKTWCNGGWKTTHQTIILKFPFPRHPHFALLTPDYVSLCTGINTSSYLIAAAPWKAVWERSQCGFCRGCFSEVLIQFCGNFWGSIFRMFQNRFFFFPLSFSFLSGFPLLVPTMHIFIK